MSSFDFYIFYYISSLLLQVDAQLDGADHERGRVRTFDRQHDRLGPLSRPSIIQNSGIYCFRSKLFQCSSEESTYKVHSDSFRKKIKLYESELFIHFVHLKKTMAHANRTFEILQ